MTENDIRAAVALVRGAYPHQAIEKELLHAWGMMLGDLEAGPVMRALRRHIATSKWPPSIAEIRTQVTEERLALPSWPEASMQVQTWLRRALMPGMDNASRGVHPLVYRTVRAQGGALALAQADNQQRAWSDLQRAYERARAGEVETATVEPIERRLALGSGGGSHGLG